MKSYLVYRCSSYLYSWNAALRKIAMSKRLLQVFYCVFNTFQDFKSVRFLKTLLILSYSPCQFCYPPRTSNLLTHAYYLVINLSMYFFIYSLINARYHDSHVYSSLSPPFSSFVSLCSSLCFYFC